MATTDTFKRNTDNISLSGFLRNLEGNYDSWANDSNKDWEGLAKLHKMTEDLLKEQTKAAYLDFYDALKNGDLTYLDNGRFYDRRGILSNNNIAHRIALGYMSDILNRLNAIAEKKAEQFNPNSSWDSYINKNLWGGGSRDYDAWFSYDTEKNEDGSLKHTNRITKLGEYISGYANSLSEDADYGEGMTRDSYRDALLKDWNAIAADLTVDKNELLNLRKYGIDLRPFFYADLESLLENLESTPESELTQALRIALENAIRRNTDYLNYINGFSALPSDFQGKFTSLDILNLKTPSLDIPDWVEIKYKNKDLYKNDLEDLAAFRNTYADLFAEYLKNPTDKALSDLTPSKSLKFTSNDNEYYWGPENLESANHRWVWHARNLFNLYSLRNDVPKVTLDDDTYVVISENPDTGILKVVNSIGNVRDIHVRNLNPALADAIIKKWADNKFGVPSNKLGGIIYALAGNKFDKIIERREARKEKLKQDAEKAIKELEEINGTYVESGKKDFQFSTTDKVRLGAIAGDVASLVASLSGVGAPVSAAIGVASTAANLSADMMEGLGFFESLGNNAIGYGLDALSLIPFAKAAKVPRMIKSLGKYTPMVITALGTYSGIKDSDEYIKSWLKIGNSDLTTQDWRNIANSLQLVLGTSSAAARAGKANKRVNAALSLTLENLRVRRNDGTNVWKPVNKEVIDKLRKTSSITELNKVLLDALKSNNFTLIPSTERKHWFSLPSKSNTGEVKATELYDFSRPVTLYSGDLPYKYTFSPTERALGNAQLPDLGIARRARSAYNTVFHPLASRRQKTLEKPRTTNPSRVLPEVAETHSKLYNTLLKRGKTPEEIATIMGPNFWKHGGRIVSFLRNGKDIRLLLPDDIFEAVEKWYDDLYDQKKLKNVGNADGRPGMSVSGYTGGSKPYRLLSPYYANKVYTSNKAAITSDILNFLSSLDSNLSDEQLVEAYNKEADAIRNFFNNSVIYGDTDATEHNLRHKRLFASRNTPNGDFNVGNFGWDENNKHTAGRSTWARRMDRYKDEFSGQEDRIHTIKLGNRTIQVYKKANGDIGLYTPNMYKVNGFNPLTGIVDDSEINSVQTPKEVVQKVRETTLKQQSPEDQSSGDGISIPDKTTSSPNKFLETIMSLAPTLVGIERLRNVLASNKDIYNTMKESLKPVLRDTYEVAAPEHGNYGRMMAENQIGSDLEYLASKPFTSDASLLLATQLDAELKAGQHRILGFLEDDKMRELTRQLAIARVEDNIKRRSEVANFNRQSLNLNHRDLALLRADYKLKNLNALNTFLSGIEQSLKDNYNNYKSFASQVFDYNNRLEVTQLLDQMRREYLTWANALTASGKDSSLASWDKYDEWNNRIKVAMDNYNKNNFEAIAGINHWPFFKGNTNNSFIYKDFS